MANETQKSAAHAYNPPQFQFNDVRSPCPALNALANHSYIPHNGRNITVWQLISAISKVYNTTWLFAAFLSFGGCILRGNGYSLNLSDLAKHGRVEHDGSLTRGDTLDGETIAPITPDPKRLASVLGTGDEVTLDHLCEIRRARDAELAQLNKPLNKVGQRVALGELALVHVVFSKPNGKMPVEWLRSWFGQDKLPEGWVPRQTVSFGSVRETVAYVKAYLAKLGKAQ